MKMPDPLKISQQDWMECSEDSGYRTVFASIECDLSDDDLLVIQEWCEQARAWMKERKEEKK